MSKQDNFQGHVCSKPKPDAMGQEEAINFIFTKVCSIEHRLTCNVCNQLICNHPKPLTYLNLPVNVKSSNCPCIMNTIVLFAVLLFGTFLLCADPASVSYTGEVTTDSPKNGTGPAMFVAFLNSQAKQIVLLVTQSSHSMS